MKEARNIAVEKCSFSLRYPLWHVKSFSLADSAMDELTRAAIWYADDGEITGSRLHGIKAVRECGHIRLIDCDIDSQEFGWKCTEITMKDCTVNSEYLFFDSKNVTLSDIKMTGKYSFQYMENLVIENCTMEETDLAFEYSDVEADIIGNVMSVKNPRSGRIILDSVDEVIMEDAAMECSGEVIVRIGGQRCSR